MLVALVAPEKVPAGHDVHDLLPSKLYVPVPQFMQVAMLVAAKLAEAVPAGHSTHFALPTKLYDPAGHSEHMTLPGLLYSPSRHELHTSLVFTPMAVEYVPPGHGVHCANFSTDPYEPDGQSIQAGLPGGL